MFEMQGELQYKEHLHRLDKKNAPTSVETFAGLPLGRFQPHKEHGVKRPELRIGNLVLEGKLVKLPKPLLVVTKRKINDDDGEGDTQNGDGGKGQKRKRIDEEDGLDDDLYHKHTRSGRNGKKDDDDESPSTCLQSVAIVRYKYLFTSRPYAICESSAPEQSSTAATPAPAATQTKKES